MFPETLGRLASRPAPRPERRSCCTQPERGHACLLTAKQLGGEEHSTPRDQRCTPGGLARKASSREPSRRPEGFPRAFLKNGSLARMRPGHPPLASSC